MGFFDKLFGRKKPATPSASDVARERLTLMLVHDRLKLTPDLLDRIKGELLEVISKYVEIDETGVDVELTHSEHSDKLVARMPVKRQRLQFQRDVLEPGMGNPLVAAAALAQIHQPPASASAAPASNPPAATPEATAAPADSAPASSPGASDATLAPAAAGPAASEAPAAPAEKPTPAETTGASGEMAAPAAEAVTPASTASEPATVAAVPPVANGDMPPSVGEASAAPGSGAAPAAPEATAAETPAPTATPTKG